MTIDRVPLAVLSTNKMTTASSKPVPKNSTVTHARKLKYRLKLAYYKLRTDQATVPIAEIMKKQESPLSKKKSQVTPSLTRHISLLAASTPLHPHGLQSILPKKKVAFSRSASSFEPSMAKWKPRGLSKINENHTFKSTSLRIEDLVNTSHGNSTVTPVKCQTDDNGDLIMSSPTKKLCSSTPGSYGAAKSLLQLSSIISSN
jgi:hypothetical protein